MAMLPSITKTQTIATPSRPMPVQARKPAMPPGQAKVRALPIDKIKPLIGPKV